MIDLYYLFIIHSEHSFCVECRGNSFRLSENIRGIYTLTEKKAVLREWLKSIGKQLYHHTIIIFKLFVVKCII